ncbi:MAG: xylS, partial [Paenibacillus sp.]|nr:xylS [Paenibacillus sp.]
TRLGIVSPPPSPITWYTEEDATTVQIITDEAILHLDRHNGCLSILDKSENLLTTQRKPAYGGGDAGFGAQFVLADDERLYGLGDQYDTPLMKRGRTTSISLRSNRVHAPVPLLLSSSGWALLVDTESEHEFDVGQSSPDELYFHGHHGELAYYLIAGGHLAELLHKYAQLTGPSVLLPIWAYGLSFICNQQTSARDMIEDALKFRREGIPCDMIGLEPTWMDQSFDFEAPVQWHPDRFYIPQWMPEGAHTFMGALQTMGFKLSLGLYLPENAHTASNTTDPSWYDYLKPFVAQGVQGFKLCTTVPVQEKRYTPNSQINEESPSTLTIPASISKTIQEGYTKQTGMRPIVYTPVGYTGIQKYAAMWSGGRNKPHLSVLGLGLSGISNMGIDMNLHNPAGIHFGFLQPWSKINSWAYWRHPLLLDPNLLTIFKMYAKLRYRLLPYIYSAASVAARTGMPIARAMPLVYPEDNEALHLQNQYMFGDDFLVAVFTDEIYLPAGEWIDYWTGDTYSGPSLITYQTPSHVGGPLFVRAGAIIPMWPEMEYAGMKVPERMELHLYPGQDGQAMLYEDDGVSLGYLEGESVFTHIASKYSHGNIIIDIGQRTGQYRNMKTERCWDLFIHTHDKPVLVKVNGEDWREATGGRKDLMTGLWSMHRKAGWIRVAINEVTTYPAMNTHIEFIYSIEKDARHTEQRSNNKFSPPARKTTSELEKELEIGLETGDESKALSTLEQWWNIRTAGDHTLEDIREHWLYMNGLIVRSIERKGRTLIEVLGEQGLHQLQFHPADGAEHAYHTLSEMVQLIVQYDNKQRGRANESIRQATDIIMQEIDQELTLHAVADRLHLNSSYLSRRFKKEIGISFSDYVLDKKMELAKELLLNGSSVNATAERTGFKEASYFIRVFRKYWGVTPGEMKP